MEKQRLTQQFAFILEADKEKMIQRQTYVSDGQRRENDAEHAWHLALMTILLSEYSNEPIDVLKTVKIVLIHDIVEIDAGDTFAYDQAGLQTKKAREQAAADRLFALLPDDQQHTFYALWEEFEAGQTPEARFARTMDNIQPTMLNDATGGKMWREKGIHLSQIRRRNQSTAKGSHQLWQYAWQHFIFPHVQSGEIIDDEAA